MYRIYKILAIAFVALISYVDIGLLYNVNHGLHAHIVDNNQILIHLHYSYSKPDNATHHNVDYSSGTVALCTTFLTFLDDGQSVLILEHFRIIHAQKVSIDFVIPPTKQINSCFLRAPPSC